MMWDELLNALSFTFGTPGKMIRSGMVGENPFQYSFGDYWYGRDRSPTGRDVLERWGALGENREGLDFGDVAGFGVDLLDPWNLLAGAGAASKALRAGRGAMVAGRAAAKPFGYAAGIGAGMTGLNHWLQPEIGTSPNSGPQLNDMHTAALLEAMLRDEDADEYV